MRILRAAPTSFRASPGGGPAFGSFKGPLPPVDLAATPVERALRRKKWLYLAVVSDEVWLSMAVVRMGYATSAFAFVFDRRSRAMLVDRTVVAPPRAAEIADDAHAAGALARFGFGRSHLRAVRANDASLEVEARFGALELDFVLDEAEAPPPIAAIASLGPSLASATEKRALTGVKGSLVVHGNRFSLDGAFGGYDYTHGLMPRNTRWQWAFGMGRTTDGEPVALNMTRGFVGEAECAVFHRGEVHPMGEPRFTLDRARPDQPWRLCGDGVDLTFDVGAVHEQRTNLLLVRSRFLQPVGAFRGTLRVGEEAIELDGMPGVVEDQDVLW